MAVQESQVAPIIASYWERAEFPHEVVPKLAKLNLGGGTIKGFGCAGQSVVEAGLTCIELARVDGSMSTFLMVHNSLCMLTIDLLGSQEQKQQLLPDLAALKTVGAWGLTEPSNGSDASALQTSATKVDGGYELNGCKRWIGNATFADWVVIWARNSETNQVNAFVVKKGTKGFKTTKIENKIALRCVQNADITMEKCFVPDSARLPGVNSFKVGQGLAPLLLCHSMMCSQQLCLVLLLFLGLPCLRPSASKSFEVEPPALCCGATGSTMGQPAAELLCLVFSCAQKLSQCRHLLSWAPVTCAHGLLAMLMTVALPVCQS